MHPRLYRLIEAYQRIDALLRLEQRRPSDGSYRLLRLQSIKLRIKNMFHHLPLQPGRS